MSIKDLEAEQKRHAEVSAKLMADIKQAILDLPDNPRINRLPGSLVAFTMSVKNLGSNWSVGHHDFKLQYELVVKLMERSETPVECLKYILLNGCVKESPGHIPKLHPDVIAHLCKLAGFRWKSKAEWPKGTTCQSMEDKTEDSHDTKHAAECVCRSLEKDGFGGQGKAFPIKTWVELE